MIKHLLLHNKLWLTALIATIAFVLIHIYLYNPREQQGSDNLENLAGAYNIAKYNTFSVYTSDDKPHPSAAREPFFPLILGMTIKVKNIFSSPTNDIRNQPIESIYNLKIQPLPMINSLKIVNIFILYSTIFLSCSFIFRITKSFFLLIYAATSLIFSSALATGAQSFLTEPLAALLCTLISILLFFSKKLFHRPFYCFLLSVSIAALVLTKAVYLYFIPIIFVFLIRTHLQEMREHNKQFLLNMAIFTTCLILSIGGWMLRNYINFDRFFIADRKAEVLMYRAEYDRLSSQEYPYVFAVWAPGLSKYFLKPETKSSWKSLINLQGNDGVIIGAYQSIYGPFFKDAKLNPNGRYNQFNYISLENQSLHRIFTHKMGHLKLTLAFLYRSFFIEDGAGLRYLGFRLPYEANYERRVDSFLLALFVNLPVWLVFFYVTNYSIRRKNSAYLGLILIPSYTVLIYSCLAFTHPRYMQPLIPTLTIIFCIGLKQIFRIALLRRQAQ